jgi:hypothetical protein
MNDQGGPSSPRADWYADPVGRHQYRYWDGTRWTDHVANNGEASVDPLTQQPTREATAQEQRNAETEKQLRDSFWVMLLGTEIPGVKVISVLELKQRFPGADDEFVAAYIRHLNSEPSHPTKPGPFLRQYVAEFAENVGHEPKRPAADATASTQVAKTELRDGDYVTCSVCQKQTLVKVFGKEQQITILGPEAIESLQRQNVSLQCQKCGVFVCFSCASSTSDATGMMRCPECDEAGGLYFIKSD